jgi:hypothetical protein
MIRLNPKEIKEKYPKVTAKMIEYVTNGYEKENIPNKIKEQISPENLISYLIFGTRGLYDFFDAYELYICVGRSDDKFGFGLGDFKHGLNGGQWFDGRLEAEKEAFLTAFDKLEKQLNDESGGD